MNKAATDVAQALTRLSELTIFELRGEWRRLHRTPPPMRLSRDLLTRGITYKLQECALRDLHPQIVRRWPRAGIQFSRRPAGGVRGLYREPTSCRMGRTCRHV